MNNTQLNIQQQNVSLKRFPANQFDKSLRAWDAADEYIIDHVSAHFDLKQIQRIVIINDAFGALTCAMSRLAPQAEIQVYTDSYMSECGILQNLKGSNLDKNKVTINASLELAQIESLQLSSCHTDLVLLKVPRTLAYLKYLLMELNRTYCTTTPPVNMVSGAMVKLITSSVVKAFEYALSDVHTSLARKKSRLVFSQFVSNKSMQSTNIKVINDDKLPFALHNYPNVFCRDQVDIGARYMLTALPKISNSHQVIIDLGCGNGILGTSILAQASAKGQSLKLIYIDESYMAIASAKASLANSTTVSEENKEQAEFMISHCLRDFLKTRMASVDLVVCNPPFHQQSTIIDDIAWQMFTDAYKALKVGGELRIVGNRHLEHTEKLSKLYGGCKVMASNKKFVVLSSIKES